MRLPRASRFWRSSRSGAHSDEVARTMAFSFAAGSNYFLEIAKLRSARTLWARAVAAFNPANLTAAKMTVYARTSHATKTIYDPYVNVLRATTEAMSAAIGGADSIQVEAFDRTYRQPDEAGRRLARNTQLILRDEALLDRCVDAAGGSYYLESLTDSRGARGVEPFPANRSGGRILEVFGIWRIRAGSREVAGGSRFGGGHPPRVDPGHEPVSQPRGADAGEDRQR